VKLILCLFAGALILCSQAPAALTYQGVNLAGAEFGYPGAVPGNYGFDYIYPNQGEVDYYLGKGMNTFRLPFLWERLQPTLGGGFDAQEWSRLSTFVNETTAKGGYVILDPHDFAQYVMDDATYAIGSPEVTIQHFAAFWGQLANGFKDNDHVIFGLMNEPPGTPVITTELWFTAAQAAIDSIRLTDAENLILVPGNYYTGAWSWVSGNGQGTANADALAVSPIQDTNFAFEVHQYLDSNYSGTSPSIDHDPVLALSAFTTWLQLTGNKGFLAEFAVAEGLIQQAAVTAMLADVAANSDVWSGWTWWAGGPWWNNEEPNYMFNLDPIDGVDAPQMAYLEPFLVTVPEPQTWALLLGGGLWVGLKCRKKLTRRPARSAA
jgi:endoglucanase